MCKGGEVEDPGGHHAGGPQDDQDEGQAESPSISHQPGALKPRLNLLQARPVVQLVCSSEIQVPVDKSLISFSIMLGI